MGNFTTKARIIIRDGIERRETAGSKQLMDPGNEKDIKAKIEAAVDAILEDTEYVRINPPTIGVEKET